MLSVEEILEIGKNVGVDITDGIDNKHYIFNDHGEKIEFNVGMLSEDDRGLDSFKIEFKISINDKKYDLSNNESSYVVKTENINESITEAA